MYRLDRIDLDGAPIYFMRLDRKIQCRGIEDMNKVTLTLVDLSSGDKLDINIKKYKKYKRKGIVGYSRLNSKYVELRVWSEQAYDYACALKPMGMYSYQPRDLDGSKSELILKLPDYKYMTASGVDIGLTDDYLKTVHYSMQSGMVVYDFFDLDKLEGSAFVVTKDGVGLLRDDAFKACAFKLNDGMEKHLAKAVLLRNMTMHRLKETFKGLDLMTVFTVNKEGRINTL